MDSSSSPPVLYLGDDDDDDDDNRFRASSFNNVRLPSKKRKLTNTNVHANPSMTTWSKRQRNNYYHQPHLLQNFVDPDPDPILLDPDDYIIEEPDSHSFRSFDWTIETRPPPLPPPILPKKIFSTPIQTSSRVSTGSIMNSNNVAKRPVNKPDVISVGSTNDIFIRQQRKPIAAPVSRPSVALLTLPSTKPTSSFIQANTRRGRPLKNSRVPHPQSTSPPPLTRQRSESQIFPPTQQNSHSLPSSTTTVPTSSVNNSTSEIRRQVLNGTGLFSAFHDSKYYQCNICKFKSVTSSTLLQHLFTHMFFCEQCSFYTYSHYNLSQHIFEKHPLTTTDISNDSINPKSFDLLYVTRCPDGTFALCMDSSTNKVTNTDQRLIISSATLDEQQETKTSKKLTIPQKDILNDDDNDIVLLPDKRDNNQRTITRPKEKGYRSYVLMKHRKIYAMKKPVCLHALTLEYNICREQAIRHMCHTQDLLKRRKYLTKFHKTRLIDEVADCLRTVVNRIVHNEENRNQSSLICALPNQILASILSLDNLNIITSSLKLVNKFEQYQEQNYLYDQEHPIRENHEDIYVLSSLDTTHNEQSIISSLHSSMTNGNSIFTQTKITKTPAADNTAQRYFRKNLNNVQPSLNNSKPKVPMKTNAIQSSLPKVPPLRHVNPRPIPNSSLPIITDKNNNSVLPSSSKISPGKIPNVIVLD